MTGPLAFDVADAKVISYEGALVVFLADATLECDGVSSFFENPGVGTFGEQHLLLLGVTTPSDCADPFSDCAVGSFDGASAFGYLLWTSDSGEDAAWQSETGTIDVATASSASVTGSFDLVGQVAPGGGTADTSVTGSFSAASCPQ